MKNKYRTFEDKKRDDLKGLLVLIFAGLIIAAILNRNAVSHIGKNAVVLNIYGLVFLILSCIGLIIVTFKAVRRRLGFMTVILFLGGFATMLYFTYNWCYKLSIDAANDAVREQLMVSSVDKEEFYGAYPLHVSYSVTGYSTETDEMKTFKIDKAHYEELTQDDNEEHIMIDVKYLPGTKTLLELQRMEFSYEN